MRLDVSQARTRVTNYQFGSSCSFASCGERAGNAYFVRFVVPRLEETQHFFAKYHKRSRASGGWVFVS